MDTLAIVDCWDPGGRILGILLFRIGDAAPEQHDFDLHPLLGLSDERRERDLPVHDVRRRWQRF
jgi:hypothetical protein